MDLEAEEFQEHWDVGLIPRVGRLSGNPVQGLIQYGEHQLSRIIRQVAQVQVPAHGAEVAALSSDEQAATNKSRNKTAGQKMPWRQDKKIKFKKRSPGNLHSSAVVMEYYE